MAIFDYNLIDISDIQLSSSGARLSSGQTTSTVNTVANRVILVQSLVITNYDFVFTNAAEVSVYLTKAVNSADADQGNIYLCKDVVVPHKTSLVVVNESTPIYLRYNGTGISNPQGLTVEFTDGTGSLDVSRTAKIITVT